MRGASLVEVVVALAVVSLAAGLAAVAVTSHPTSEGDLIVARLDSARAVAVRTGDGIQVRIAGTLIQFSPDGSANGGPVITDSVVYRVDPLTGEVRRASR